jgi:hypothetical protein
VAFKNSEVITLVTYDVSRYIGSALINNCSVLVEFMGTEYNLVTFHFIKDLFNKKGKRKTINKYKLSKILIQ